MRRMGVSEYFRQDMMSPRRDSHINYALVAHEAINPEKLKTHTPEQRYKGLGSINIMKKVYGLDLSLAHHAKAILN